MLRRWRLEIARHESPAAHVGGYAFAALAPIPPQDREVWEADLPGRLCHCYRGMGTMRKRTLGCANPRCGLCHAEKFYAPKARSAKNRAAIAYELDDS
jgi:hypothetical protein